MIWSNKDNRVNRIANLTDGGSWLLTFNEPNGVDQSNLSPQAVAGIY